MLHIIPTCESAVSTVPEWHRETVKGHEERARSSEGWSPGALNLAQGVSMKVHSQLIHPERTRLLIDLWCHPDLPERWSDLSRNLTDEQREKLDRRYKQTYVDHIENQIENLAGRSGQAIHLSFDTRQDY